MNTTARQVFTSLAFALTFAAPGLCQSLEQTIRALHSNAKLGGADVGLAVQDAVDGQMLAEIQSSRPMTPASNLKLITSGVALTVLGADFEFRTSFVVQGKRMVIKASGDPAFGDPMLLQEQGWTIDTFLAQIVNAAKAKNVSGVSEIVIDDGVFAREPIHDAWPKAQLNRWYCAPVHALNFHTNCLSIWVRPGDGPGRPPAHESQPRASWIQIDASGSKTVREGSTSVWAAQQPMIGGTDSGMEFKLFGDVREPIKDPIEVTVEQPGILFARLLADAMVKAGVALNPSVRMKLDSEELDIDERQAFAVVTTPIMRVLERCNVNSQNLYAEALLKRTAHDVTRQPGSWTTGAQVVAMKVSEMIGQEIRDLVISDGSGLSANNRVSAQTMVRWLTALHKQPRIFEVFSKSMARGDVRGHRLFERLRDERINNRVFAKTGFIRGVRCLSGYVVSPNGDRVAAFSILVNDIDNIPHSRVSDFQDDVVAAIDRHISSQLPKSTRQDALGGNQ